MNNVVIKNEIVSPAKLNKLIKSSNVSEEDKKKLRKYKKRYVPNKGYRVEYEHAKSSYNYGRIYPFEMVGLSAFRSTIRNYLASDAYDNYDMVNAHPTILSQLMDKHGIEDKFLKNYIKHPTKMREYLSSSMDITMKEAKGMFYNIMYDNNFTSENKKIMALHTKIYTNLIGVLSINEEYKDLYASINKCKKTKIDIWRGGDFSISRENKNGRFLSLILQNIEFNIMKSCVEFFRTKEIETDVFIHDGFMVQKNEIMSDKLLVECAKHIKESIGYDATIVEEPMTDMVKLDKVNDIDDAPLSKMEEVTDYLFKTMNNNFRHDETYIYEKDESIPILYHKIDKFEDWIDTQFQEDNKYLRYYRMINKDSYCKSLLQRDDPFFKRMNNTKNVMVFTNGYLDFRNPHEVSFIKFTEVYDDDITSIIHIDRDCDLGKETPLFDSVFEHQELSKEITEYFMGMVMGRSFYNLRQFDKYQMFPYIYGDVQTGKSFICNLLEFINPNTASINVGSSSKDFCLEAIYDKDVGIFDDMPEYLETVIEATNIQKMSSSQMMTVNRKNKVAINVRWDVPIIFISNFFVKIQGNNRAIARRLMCFNFTNTVNGNTNLLDEIIDREIENVIIKCCASYSKLVNKHKSTAFFNWDIEYFKKFQVEYTSEDDIIDQFIKSDCIVFDDNNKISIEQFRQVFISFQKQNNIPRIKTNLSADQILRKLIAYDDSINITSIKICKLCRKVYDKKCCNQSNRNNRINMKYINGITMNERDIWADDLAN